MQKVQYWQLNYALGRLKDWGATGVAVYQDEVGNYAPVYREGGGWKIYSKEKITLEQFKALSNKTSYTLGYVTANTTGTLLFMFFPKAEGEQAKIELAERIEKEMNSGLPHKR